MKATSRHWTRSWPVILLGVFAFIANPYRSVAVPCDGVPDCEPQVMDIVQYSELQTKGWAYYCGGDHPYYWNNDPILGFGNNFSADNSCFKITENPFVEDVNKMDATITNWCNAIEVVAVTLGCSRQPQAGPSCPNNNTKITDDPNCPMQGSPVNHCSNAGVPVCFQTWTEQCSTGPAYCTDNLGVIWCVTCQ